MLTSIILGMIHMTMKLPLPIFYVIFKAGKLSRGREVASVILDFFVMTDTMHTHEFLGFPEGAWPENRGYDSTREGILIGFVNTGIDHMHPSFSDSMEANAHPHP